MPLIHPALSDRTGLLGAAAGLFAELPLAAVYGYLLAQLLVPVLLIILAGHHASPAQRITLVRDYLLGRTSPRRGQRRRGET